MRKNYAVPTESFAPYVYLTVIPKSGVDGKEPTITFSETLPAKVGAASKRGFGRLKTQFTGWTPPPISSLQRLKQDRCQFGDDVKPDSTFPPNEITKTIKRVLGNLESVDEPPHRPHSAEKGAAAKRLHKQFRHFKKLTTRSDVSPKPKADQPRPSAVVQYRVKKDFGNFKVDDIVTEDASASGVLYYHNFYATSSLRDKGYLLRADGYCPVNSFVECSSKTVCDRNPNHRDLASPPWRANDRAVLMSVLNAEGQYTHTNWKDYLKMIPRTSATRRRLHHDLQGLLP